MFVQGHQHQTSFIIPLYEGPAWPKRPLWYQDRAHLPHPDLNAIGLRVPSWHDVVKIPLPRDVKVSQSHLVPNPISASSTMLARGDKIYVVGFPYGSTTGGASVPTAVVLTRFVTAPAVSSRHQNFLLDSGGTPGMSGGPVFVERDDYIALLGVYTGIVYPGPTTGRFKDSTALGACVNLSWCWRGSLPLVPSVAQSPEGSEHDPGATSFCCSNLTDRPQQHPEPNPCGTREALIAINTSSSA
jgi:hypothetical protein